MRPQFCCIYLHQQLRLGWVRGRTGNRLEIVLEDGAVVCKHPGDLLHCWEGEPFPGGNSAKAEALEQMRRESADGEASRRIADAVYAGAPPGRRAPFRQLAERTLGKGVHGWREGRLFLALLRDRRRFRFARGAFAPRGAEEIAEWEAREAERRAERAWKEKAERWAAELQRGEWPHGGEGEAGEFLAALQSLLAREKRSPHWQSLARTLGVQSLPPADLAARIKGWLDTAGRWPGWPAIWLEWGEVSLAFPPALEEAARGLAAAPLRAGGRSDFRAVPAYSIDSAGTRDFDDAVSILAADAGGLTVALHIAEPDPALEPGHPLFEEAARRMASVYVIGAVYPMFPPALSAGRFSLLAGEERETATLILRVREGETELQGIERGLVRLEQNLDFRQAQELLESQPARWGRLAALCRSLNEARLRAGAALVEREELFLDISDPERIRLEEISRSGPVHQLVEELAVAYNRHSGLYCREHGIPAIYRVQPQPPAAATDEEEGEAYWAARFSTTPAPHAGLACEAYVQATSPIRRFADLAMQRQIVGHAAGGGAPFAAAGQWEEWAARAEERSAAYAETARRIAEDWKRRYLQQRLKEGGPVVLEGRVRGAPQALRRRVWLERLRLQARCELPPELAAGESVRVRVQSVDRERREVWCSLAGDGERGPGARRE